MIGSAHSTAMDFEHILRDARAALAAREGDDGVTTRAPSERSHVFTCGPDAIAERAKE